MHSLAGKTPFLFSSMGKPIPIRTVNGINKAAWCAGRETRFFSKFSEAFQESATEIHRKQRSKNQDFTAPSKISKEDASLKSQPRGEGRELTGGPGSFAHVMESSADNVHRRKRAALRAGAAAAAAAAAGGGAGRGPEEGEGSAAAAANDDDIAARAAAEVLAGRATQQRRPAGKLSSSTEVDDGGNKGPGTEEEGQARGGDWSTRWLLLAAALGAGTALVYYKSEEKEHTSTQKDQKSSNSSEEKTLPSNNKTLPSNNNTLLQLPSTALQQQQQQSPVAFDSSETTNCDDDLGRNEFKEDARRFALPLWLQRPRAQQQQSTVTHQEGWRKQQ